MEAAYAQALWKMVDGGPGRAGMAPHKAVSSLKDLLEKEGRLALMPRIARAFERYAEKEARKRDVVLTVAREKDIRKAEKEVSGLLKELGVESKDLKTQVDDSLIGGWRLEGKDTLVDGSYKKQLLDIYNRAVA